MKSFKTIFFCFLMVIVYFVFFNNKESFTNLSSTTKCFSCEQELQSENKYIGGVSKCFSCEKQLPNDLKYIGGVSKCFSCDMNVPNYQFISHSPKLY